MKNKHSDIHDIKEFIAIISILLGGAALTATSFCVYYLVKPLHPAVLAVICVFDFLYTLLCSCILFKYGSFGEKWLLKGFLLAVGYVVAFIVVVEVVLFLGGLRDAWTTIETMKRTFRGVVCYAFFTGPCIYIVLILVVLCMAFAP